jgi:transposase-like protein
MLFVKLITKPVISYKCQRKCFVQNVGHMVSWSRTVKPKMERERYRCESCHRTSIVNVSPTKHLHKSDHLIRKIIGYMIDDVALEVIACNLKINIKTAHYDRFLVFHALKDYQNRVTLTGSILIDDTFISIREKRNKIVKYKCQDKSGSYSYRLTLCFFYGKTKEKNGTI